MINASNIVNVNITTNTTAQVSMNFSASVDSSLYDININDAGTTASDLQNVIISIENNGLFNVIVHSVYINDTFIPLNSFTEGIYEIGVGNSIQLTISMGDLEDIIGPVNIGEILKILVRTKEGAEDVHEETVVS
jgi:hypothetical protein